ncbi:MAG: hypothetical protein A2087_06440 [Spirochaetes bacterium GWD1_61_31]|nr:MAG: hypothetical protein A2Y37_09030 [Spirochaetes bacterium GWB1_60_80]OHD31921.1 MAG: hypothetical protein A2004_10415 [Spirochaetes bacterium GWC1_61_12]OHD40252.1 MAG: hypothetical protein A2087_06440 [Spirochaetes bacterium GWD1_61_31]OHD42374.1 MAG: hypothetical protein A2Y35_11560 [Spirochaetes bacterium GWE1_60_18]OHD60553.1 MAG: hypothetical protein A2Y32_03775 [Spirochaetes bacterium GWF1_60_12]HAW86968.1 hypothetical protein [Spirochaetaceae bacterium]
MQIKHPEIYSIIESIAQHYRNNIANRYTRPVLTLLPLENAHWLQIEELTEKSDHYRYQGYHLDELYPMIVAMGKFIMLARKQGLHMFKQSAALADGRMSTQDKLFRDMALSNFAANLNVLADAVNKLYVKVVEIDREHAGSRPPILNRYPELNELGRYLVE